MIPEIFTKPVFYDYAGIFVFSFITYIGWKLHKKEKLKKWMITVLIIIGVLGLLVDSIMVTFFGRIFSIIG